MMWRSSPRVQRYRPCRPYRSYDIAKAMPPTKSRADRRRGPPRLMAAPTAAMRRGFRAPRPSYHAHPRRGKPTWVKASRPQYLVVVNPSLSAGAQRGARDLFRRVVALVLVVAALPDLPDRARPAPRLPPRAWHNPGRS